MDSDGDGSDSAPLLERCGIVFEQATGRVSVRGRPVSLTRRELQVLALLMAANGRAMNASEIQERVWADSSSGSPSQVAMIVARLRRRLGNARLIETIGGEGYRIAASSEPFRGP
jgi:two-component system, OmpR family, response regulator VanR